MGEWKEYKLGDFVKSISETYKFKHDEEVVFLNTSDIYLGRVINKQLTNSSTLPGQAKKRIKRGDFLFSEIRPANGRYALIDFDAGKYVVSTKLMVLRCNDKINLDFFRLFLTAKDQLDYLQMIADDRSGTFPQITFDHIANLDITLPPLPEQKSIASVLSSLDDKIDLLHRQNKTLEALAETLFRQWFVEEAEEGWEEKSLVEIAEYLNGLALQKYPAKGIDDLPVIKIREMRQGISENTDLCSRDIPSQYIIHDGDILFSWSGSLEVVIWHDGEGALNQHLFKISSDKYPKWFYYLATKYHLANFKMIAETKSTTMGHIQREHLREATILIPPKELFAEYDNKIAPLIEKKIKNNAQIKILTRLRDTLLPKLISGDVGVNNSNDE